MSHLSCAILTAFVVSTASAAPLQVTIEAESVAMPAGTVGRVEIGAEFHADTRKSIATTRAPERAVWTFSATNGPRDRHSFRFHVPGVRTAPDAAIYIPVTYTIAVPGFPEVENESTYVIRIEDASKPVSRCLRFELINDGQSLRAGLLPTCEDSFDKRGGTVLLSD